MSTSPAVAAADMAVLRRSQAFDLLASLQEGVPVKCQIDPTPSHSVINHPYVTVGVDNTSAPLGLQLTPATCKGVFLTGVKPDSAAAASAGLAAAYPDHSGSSHEVWTKQVRSEHNAPSQRMAGCGVGGARHPRLHAVCRRSETLTLTRTRRWSTSTEAT